MLLIQEDQRRSDVCANLCRLVPLPVALFNYEVSIRYPWTDFTYSIEKLLMALASKADSSFLRMKKYQ